MRRAAPVADYSRTHPQEKRGTCRQRLHTHTHKPHRGEPYLLSLCSALAYIRTVPCYQSRGVASLSSRLPLGEEALRTPSVRHKPINASTHHTKPHIIRNVKISADQYQTTVYHKHSLTQIVRVIILVLLQDDFIYLGDGDLFSHGVV